MLEHQPDSALTKRGIDLLRHDDIQSTQRMRHQTWDGSGDADDCTDPGQHFANDADGVGDAHRCGVR
ncbi:hypothetical protein [Brachybacterium huguangmaarense]